MALIERVVGTGDPDLLVMLREAEKVGRGTRTDLEPGSESEPGSNSESSGYTAARLARDAPNVYAAVQANGPASPRCRKTTGARGVLTPRRPAAVSASVSASEPPVQHPAEADSLPTSGLHTHASRKLA